MVCDRKVGLPARVKGKVYKVAVRPAMLYGLDTVALTKRQEAEMEVTELKMLRFSLGVTIMDTIRNESSEGQHRWESLEKTREAILDGMVTRTRVVSLVFRQHVETNVNATVFRVRLSLSIRLMCL